MPCGRAAAARGMRRLRRCAHSSAPGSAPAPGPRPPDPGRCGEHRAARPEAAPQPPAAPRPAPAPAAGAPVSPPPAAAPSRLSNSSSRVSTLTLQHRLARAEGESDPAAGRKPGAAAPDEGSDKRRTPFRRFLRRPLLSLWRLPARALAWLNHSLRLGLRWRCPCGHVVWSNTFVVIPPSWVPARWLPAHCQVPGCPRPCYFKEGGSTHGSAVEWRGKVWLRLDFRLGAGEHRMYPSDGQPFRRS
eukprot:TRINITY_DN61284_c0_g1_i1.p1 TRINITY_DN61284_c0_g1~~TRINITY_DN61284_c0_g1_i1.p1  ORF type:complete len:276 (+),score=47.51 TRINITY_DN61284_c0_g1_i1:96-830(+)